MGRNDSVRQNEKQIENGENNRTHWHTEFIEVSLSK